MSPPTGRDLEATCVLPAGAQLGECPIWDPADDLLYWIDIDGRAIHRYDPTTGLDEQRPTPGRPGSIAFTGKPGRLLVAIETRLATFDWGAGTCHDWITLEPEDVGNRLNDGRCDPAGRFWVGTMFESTGAHRASGTLHRVEPDGTAVAVRSAVGVPNGLAFAPDGRTMYWADTHRDTVWAYDYDAASGEASNERIFLDFASLPGRPDGACVDADGCYWIACVYGAMVIRVTPGGQVDRQVRLPVKKPTMPAFGGPDMSTLFITTIGGGGSHQVDPAQPLAGGLFAVDVGVRGLPEARFAGPVSVTA